MKKVLLLLSFICLPSALFSCGWSPTYNQFSLFFHPIDKGDKMYPFKFVADEHFYNYDVDRYYYHHTYTSEDYIWNNQEWKRQLNTKATLQDINDFVYHYPYENLKSLYYHIERNKKLVVPDSMKQNGLTKYFMQKKDFETLGYLMYAKQCEQEDNKRKSIDKWQYESYKNRKADEGTFKLIKSGTQLFKAAKSDWIKKRYAFQFVRLAHYYKEFKKADALYKEYVLPLAESNSLADYWLWGLRGGMLRRLNKKEEAAVWFARTVVRSPDKYIQAYNDFTHIGISAERILPYCNSYLDSADVLFVSSLGKKGARIDYLEELYELQPNSYMLPLLMSRELAKLEQGFLPKKILSDNFSDWSARSYKSNKVNSAEQGLEQLTTLTERILKENNKQDKAFVSNYLAYLYLAKGRPDVAQTIIETNGIARKNNNNGIQAGLLDWVARFKSNSSIEESELFSFLERLEKVSTKNQSVQSAKYHFLKYFVAPYFEKTNQPMRKAYALLKANVEEGYWSDYGQDNVRESLVSARDELSHYLAYLLSFDNLERILSTEKNKRTTDRFIEYASNNVKGGFGVQSLYNIIMRKHIRNQNWQEAQRYYAMGKPEARKYDDPLVFRTREECRVSYYNDKYEVTRIYTTEEVLKMAESLKGKIKKKKSTDLFKYGLLLYNLSYYGVLENLSVYDHRNYGVPAYTGLRDSTTYESVYYPIPRNQGMRLVAELDNYFNLTEAAAYFQKALKKSKSEEERAQCAFMLALCWQKTGDAKIKLSKTDYVSTSLANPYFKLLKNEFGGTQTYQSAYGTCAYLRMFAGK